MGGGLIREEEGRGHGLDRDDLPTPVRSSPKVVGMAADWLAERLR